VLVLGYFGLLAGVAGFVNAVALLVLVFPVGNLTALTTQLGMNTANPLLYEGSMIAAIVFGFLAGAVVAGALLAGELPSTGPRQAAVLVGEATLLLAAIGIENPEVKALLAAGACGLQNAMTSNFQGMPIRTTHFTGTITDLGLMFGRSHRYTVDKWKATVLATTVVLFLGGGVGGAVIGGRIGDNALILPAATCLTVAVSSLLCTHRRNAYRRLRPPRAGVALAPRRPSG
jgi:uncharacterized membrane protein YoaK (UPF0700 family)